MLKLAVMAGTTEWHGYAFTTLINPVDERAFKRNKWPQYPNRFRRRARVTHLWGRDVEGTKKLAAASGVEHVVDRPEDVIGDVDGVMLCDDVKGTHHVHAPLFLRAHVPVFIDKPLAPTYADARRIVQIARKTRTPMMSCSALRYANEILDRNALAARVGDITACVGTGVHGLYSYGIHPLETMVTLMASRVKSVRNVGRAGAAIVRVTFADGRVGVLQVFARGVAYTLDVTVYGTKGHVHLPIVDGAGFYGNLVGAYLDMVDSGRPPIPYEETLNLLHALEQAGRSLKTGREEKVSTR